MTRSGVVKLDSAIISILLALAGGLCFGIAAAAAASAMLIIFGVGPDWVVAIWAFAIGFIAGSLACWNPQ